MKRAVSAVCGISVFCCVWVNGTMDNSSSAEQPVDAAAPLSEPPDLSAFERAAALLNRNEHLDDTYEQWQKKTQPRGGAGRRQITVPPPPRRPRKPAHPEFEPPPASTPLPSLSELSQSDILDLKKSTHVPRAGRRAGAVPLSADESRKAAMSGKRNAIRCQTITAAKKRRRSK